MFNQNEMKLLFVFVQYFLGFFVYIFDSFRGYPPPTILLFSEYNINNNNSKKTYVQCQCFRAGNHLINWYSIPPTISYTFVFRVHPIICSLHPDHFFTFFFMSYLIFYISKFIKNSQWVPSLLHFFPLFTLLLLHYFPFIH